jgi:predicted permease
MRFTLWLYRLLAQALPHEFKVVSGDEVVQLGEDSMKNIARHDGFMGLFRMLADAAIRIPIEYLSEMRRDLAYALRAAAHARGFAITAVLSLGLGIGIASFAYSLIYGFLFRELPLIKQPQQLVTVESSYPHFEQYRQQRDVVSGATAYMPAVPFSISLGSVSGAKAERFRGHIVSPEYFQVLGLSAERGRVFDPAIDKPGQEPVVIVSSRFWSQHLNSDPDVIGKTLRLNGHPATIIGIAPKGFMGTMPIIPCDVYIPTTASPEIVPELRNDILQNPNTKAFIALMRLAPGVTMASAEAALDVVAKRLDETIPDPEGNRKRRRLSLSEGGVMQPSTPEIRAVFYGVFGVMTGLLLAITCMNLASMLLSRAGIRQREIAIRMAVGASRFRLIRQLLTECILLSMGGGVAGLALAYWMTCSISKIRFAGLSGLQYNVRPDWHAVLFAFLLSLITGIAFALAPALAATRTGITSTMKEGFLAQLSGYRRFGLRNLTMVLQVSGSVALLLITLALSLGGRTLGTTNASIDLRTMVLMTLDPLRDGYSPDQTAAFFENLPNRLQNVSAVEASALATSAPFDINSGGRLVEAYSDIADPGKPKTALRSATRLVVGRGYFAALNETVIAGREFTDRDQRINDSPDSTIPVILNRTAARELFGEQNPIGRRIVQEPQNYEVIGMVRDLNPSTQLDRPQPTLYIPVTRDMMEHPPGDGLVLMVRSSNSAVAMEGIRRELSSTDPNLTIFNVSTLSQSIYGMSSLRRMSMVFYSTMGMFGLILASVGLAGVTAFAVTQRRKEIGIRMALGAQKLQVLRLVLREGATLIIVGSVLGLGGAMLMGHALSATFYGFARVFSASARDPRLIIGVPLLLAALALVACYLPARRATQIDPLKTLREE